MRGLRRKGVPLAQGQYDDVKGKAIHTVPGLGLPCVGMASRSHPAPQYSHLGMWSAALTLWLQDTESEDVVLSSVLHLVHGLISSVEKLFGAPAFTVLGDTDRHREPDDVFGERARSLKESQRYGFTWAGVLSLSSSVVENIFLQRKRNGEQAIASWIFRHWWAGSSMFAL